MRCATRQVKFRQFKLEVSSLQMCVLLVVNEQKVTSMEELCTQLGTNERNLKRHVQALTRYRCILCLVSRGLCAQLEAARLCTALGACMPYRLDSCTAMWPQKRD